MNALPRRRAISSLASLPSLGLSFIGLLFLASLPIAAPLRAADIAWDGGGDGVTFADAANWSGDVVPGPADRAVIIAPGTYTVQLKANASIAALTLGGTSGAQILDVNGFQLMLGTDTSIVNANGLLLLGGVIDARNWVLAIDGPLVVRGRLEWINGVIYANTYYLPPNGRVITVAPGGVMRWFGAGTRNISATIDIQGTLRWEGGATYYEQGYTVSSSGTFDIALAADAVFARAGINSLGPWVFKNTGTILKTGTGTATLQVELRNVGATVDVRQGTLVQNYASRWENTTVSAAAGTTLRLSANRTFEPHTVAGTLSGNVAGTFLAAGPSAGYFTTVDADTGTGGVVDIRGTGLQLSNAYLGGVYDATSKTYSPAPTNRGLMRFVGTLDNGIAGAFINRDTLRWESGRLLYVIYSSFANERLFEMALDADADFLPSGVNGGRPGPFMNTGTVLKTGRGTATSTVDFNTVGGTVNVRDGMLIQTGPSRWEDATVAVSADATLRLAGYIHRHVVSGALRGDVQGAFLVSGLTSGYYTTLVADTVRGGRLEIGGAGLRIGDTEIGEAGGLPSPLNVGLLRFVGGVYQYIRTGFRNEGTVRWESGDVNATEGVLLANAGVLEISSPNGTLNGSGFGGVATLANEAGGIVRKIGAVQSTLGVTVLNQGRLCVAAGRLIVPSTFNNLNRFTSTTDGIISGAGTLDVGALTADRLRNDGITAPGPGDGGEGIGTLTVRGSLPYDRLAFELGGADSALYDRLIVVGATADMDSVTALATLANGFVPVRGNYFDVVEASVAGRLLDVVETNTSVRFIDTYPGTGVRLVLDTAAAGEPIVLVIVPTLAKRQGESFDLPITVVASAAARGAGATEATCVLRFNATMLGPIGPSPRGRIVVGERIISLHIPISSTDDTTIVRYRFTATLGNDSLTALAVDSVGSNGSGVRAAALDGSFTLLDLCREGGPRLLNPDGVVAMTKARPNPITTAATFDLDLIERGPTIISLRDIRGNLIRTFHDGELPPGRLTVRLDMTAVPSGRYFLIVRTPTERLAQQVEVVR